MVLYSLLAVSAGELPYWERKERNRQSMQIATPRGESIRCMASGAEKQGGVERGRVACREMVQSHRDHLL